MVYLWVYLFMQLGAFAILSMLRRKDVVGDELKDLSGLYFRQPAAAFAMLIFMLSLGGIPPTAGFMGKFWLFSAAIESGFIWLAVIGVVNSAISLYYYVRVVVFMWQKEETLGSPITIRPAIATALVIAVVGSLLFGVYPQVLFDQAPERHGDARRLRPGRGPAPALSGGRVQPTGCPVAAAAAASTFFGASAGRPACG